MSRFVRWVIILIIIIVGWPGKLVRVFNNTIRVSETQDLSQSVEATLTAWATFPPTIASQQETPTPDFQARVDAVIYSLPIETPSPSMATPDTEFGYRTAISVQRGHIVTGMRITGDTMENMGDDPHNALDELHEASDEMYTTYSAAVRVAPPDRFRDSHIAFVDAARRCWALIQVNIEAIEQGDIELFAYVSKDDVARCGEKAKQFSELYDKALWDE